MPPKADLLPILELLPPPALRERRHRGLARHLVAVRRRAILMMSKGERPHPRRALRCRVHLHDAADDGGIGEHIVIVVVPLAERAARRCAPSTLRPPRPTNKPPPVDGGPVPPRGPSHRRKPLIGTLTGHCARFVFASH